MGFPIFNTIRFYTIRLGFNIKYFVISHFILYPQH
jgi:hypothetical protein